MAKTPHGACRRYHLHFVLFPCKPNCQRRKKVRDWNHFLKKLLMVSILSDRDRDPPGRPIVKTIPTLRIVQEARLRATWSRYAHCAGIPTSRNVESVRTLCRKSDFAQRGVGTHIVQEVGLRATWSRYAHCAGIPTSRNVESVRTLCRNPDFAQRGVGVHGTKNGVT